jgi:hypothetical protein
MLYKLDDYWITELKKADRLVNPGNNRKYPSDIKWIDEEAYIAVEDLLGWIENLDYELDHKTDELKDLKNDLESNYKPIPPEEQYEISDKDFI